MKPWLVLLFFLAAVLPLSAQSDDEIFIFVPQVKGAGASEVDNNYLTSMMQSIVQAGEFSESHHRRGADFILAAKISAAQEAAGAYNFHLALKHARTGKILSESSTRYTSLNDTANLVPPLISSLLSSDLSEWKTDDDWRNYWLYLGVNLSWSPRIYHGARTSSHIANFGGGFSAEFHFSESLSFETGINIASDWVVFSPAAGDEYMDPMMEIPLAFRYVFKPFGKNLMLGPYAGFHANIPLYRLTIPPPFAWLAGFRFGARAGPGIFFWDLRFSMDIGKSGLSQKPDPFAQSYQRYNINLGIGYKIGLMSGRKTLRQNLGMPWFQKTSAEEPEDN